MVEETTSSPRPRTTGYVVVVLSVLLPLGVLLLIRSSLFVPFYDWLMTNRGTGLLAIGLVASLMILEARLIRGGMRFLRGAVGAKAESPEVLIARRRVKRLRFITVGLFAVLTFGATELAFRVLDIQPPPTPRPSAWDAISVNNERNALGIREEWDSLEPDDRRLRIAFLGDSITFGESVEAAETFSRLAGESMNSFIERGVVTMNLGEPGTGPREQLAVYRRVAPELRPYIVVHVLYPNDLGDDLYGMLRGIYAIRDADLWVGDYSYVLKYAEKKIRQWIAMRETFAYFRGGATAEERDQAWSTLREDVVAVKEAVEADGGTYYMVLFPWLFRLDDYPLGGVHQRMRALAEELRVPYLDLFDTFGGMAADDVRISRGNEHPNPRGHQLAADAIVEFLRRELLPH